MKVTTVYEIVSFAECPTIEDVKAAHPNMGIGKSRLGWIVFGALVEDEEE